MRYLIAVHGYIGDCFFASSVAERLKVEQHADIVDFIIQLPQPKLLLQNNKWLDGVWVLGEPFPNERFAQAPDKLIQIGQVDQSVPATIQMQRQAGIRDCRVGYRIYTDYEHNSVAYKKIQELRQTYPNKPIVAWQSNWKERAYQTTPEQYENHIGGPHRDIETIVAELEKDFVMVEVGLPNGVSQTHPKALDSELYTQTASIIQYCDAMVGAEGGLTNLAAGIGTKCVITTCFIQQVYGRKGHVRQYANPQMGPAVYFPYAGHVHLEPFITDDQVIEGIRNALCMTTIKP